MEKKETTCTRHHQKARQIHNIQRASKKFKIFEDDKNRPEFNSNGKLKTVLIQGIGLFAAINFQSIRHSHPDRKVKIII
jgi:hypothetical protein